MFRLVWFFFIISGDTMSDGSCKVVIEISMDSYPVKYEVNDKTNEIEVDRFLPVSMRYPCNYGFIPDTLAPDNDPLDVLVLSSYPIIPGASIKCRLIGLLEMEDEEGEDHKLLAVPDKKIDFGYREVEDHSDLPSVVLEKIKHFFVHYKDLEKKAGKWVKIGEWLDRKKACDILSNCTLKK